MEQRRQRHAAQHASRLEHQLGRPAGHTGGRRRALSREPLSRHSASTRGGPVWEAEMLETAQGRTLENAQRRYDIGEVVGRDRDRSSDPPERGTRS